MKLLARPILLAATVLLAVIFGGQLVVDAIPTQSFFSGLFSDATLPFSMHALLALPLLALVAEALWKNRVLQLPQPRVLVALIALIACLMLSVFSADAKWTAILTLFEWIAGILACLAVALTAGRDQGPRIILVGLATAGTILALRGSLEYGQMRAIDPSWRIFAGWVNQNALAGVLTLCWFAALALTVQGGRLHRLLATVASVLILFAIFLTGSKGGLLSCGFGFAILLTLQAVWGGWKSSVRPLVPMAIVAVMILGLKASTPQGQSSVVTRAAEASKQQEQSAGFRTRLWKSAAALAQKNPGGIGLGNYRYRSAQPGLTQPTHFAHSTYLQLAAEASWAAPLILLVMIALVFAEGVRGARSLPESKNLTRAAILSGLAASLLHNQIDSLLYHFGVAIAFFAMVGVSLMLSADGVGPEVVSAPQRRTLSVVGALALIWIAFTGSQLEWVKASDPSQTALAGPLDGEYWTLRAGTGQRTAKDLVEFYERAVRVTPSLRYWRLLGRAHAANGDREQAEKAFQEALKLDPNNLPTYELLMATREGDGAIRAARELLDRARSDANTILAIPESIATEPMKARLFLAQRAGEISQLDQAVKDWTRYFTITYPRVKMLGNFAGDTEASIKEYRDIAILSATLLLKHYREAGDPRSEEVGSRLAEFESIGTDGDFFIKK